MKRIEVLKTYKIYIGGQFPRTESGRYYPLKSKSGETIANVCISSRKDFRNAVVAARAAFPGWSGKTAYNRAQILYRIAEMLEGRKDQFVAELILQGSTTTTAKTEVEASIERLIYYAGWCDKYTQIFSSVNPVAASYFNFSMPEPTGVVAIMADESTSLLGIVSVVAPVIAGGNTCIVLAATSKPLSAVTFGEVIQTSDVSSGVVNILTGERKELLEQFATHMDVNATIYCGNDQKQIKELQEKAVVNVKRIILYKHDWKKENTQGPYFIFDTQEIKTTWHPIENTGSGGGGY
ncbi:MAG: aldehyde dehydrogenase family protein [Flavobacteriales bacterium]